MGFDHLGGAPEGAAAEQSEWSAAIAIARARAEALEAAEVAQALGQPPANADSELKDAEQRAEAMAALQDTANAAAAPTEDNAALDAAWTQPEPPPRSDATQTRAATQSEAETVLAPEIEPDDVEMDERVERAALETQHEVFAHEDSARQEALAALDELIEDVSQPNVLLPSPEVERLAQQLRAGRCVLCAGPRLAPDRPAWITLIARLLDGLPEDESRDVWPLVERRPLAAAGFVRRRLGDQRFAAELSRVAAHDEIGDTLEQFGSLPFRAVISTGFDDLIERAFTRDGEAPRVCTPREISGSLADDPRTIVLKILGDPARPGTLVWSTEDLLAASSEPAFRAAVADLCRGRTLLFVGFDHDDLELQILFERLLAEVPAAERFAILPGATVAEREELSLAFGVRVLSEQDPGLLAGSLQMALADAKKPGEPADDDSEGWLAILADEPGRRDAAEHLDRIAERLRDRDQYEAWIELMLGRASTQPEAAQRAETLLTVARMLEHEVDDPERALTVLCAAYREAPQVASWHELDRLAGDNHWAAVASELAEVLLDLPLAVRVPLCRKIGRFRELAEALDALAAQSNETEALPLRIEAAKLYADRLGERKKAIARFSGLVVCAPRDLDLLRTLAELYLLEGRREDQLECLEKQVELLEDDGERAAHLRELALAWQELPEHSSRARDCWERLIALEPDALDATHALEKIWREEGRYSELIELLEQRAARSVGPVRAELLREIATIYALVHDWGQAIAFYLKVLEIDGKDVAALVSLAELYAARGELLRAAALLLEAAACTPSRVDRARRTVEAARYYEALDDQCLATQLYLEVMTIDPEHLEAGERLADILWTTRRYGDLVPILEMLTRKDALPLVQLERLMRLGQAATAAGHEDKAGKAYARAAELDPTHLPAQRARAVRHLHREEWAEALPPLEAMLEHHLANLALPERVELLGDLARCYLATGDGERARELVRLSLELDPTHRPSLIVQLELEGGEPEARIEAMKALLVTARTEDQIRLLDEIGDLYQTALGDGARALGAWAEALELRPSDHRLLHKCLDVFVEDRAWPQAVETLERLIAHEKNATVRAKYHHTAGLICREELQLLSAATLHIRGALEDDPELERAQVVLEELYRAAQDWKELARLYRKILKQLGPESPGDADGKNRERLRVWSALADVCWDGLGDRPSGLAAYEVALGLQPDDLQRHKRLADLYVQAGPDHFEKSIAEHQHILRRDKGRVISYRALKHLYIQTNQREKSLMCSHALELLKKGEPDDARKVADHRRRRFATARRPLGDDGWARVLHPDEDRLLDLLFAIVGSTIVAGQAQPHKAHGLVRKDALAETDPHSYAKALTYVTTILGVPRPEAYARPDQREPLLFVNCIDKRELVPVFLLGRPLVGDRRQEVEQVFELSRAAALLRPERLLRLALPHPQPIALVIEAAMVLGDGGDSSALRDDELDRTVDGLSRTLPPPVLEQVAAIGRKLRAAGTRSEAAAVAWLHATDLTALRTGWAMTGDLGVCARLAAADSSSMATVPPTHRLLDLVWSSVTEDLFAVRKHLGIC